MNDPRFFDVGTPLLSNHARCDSDAEVKVLIQEYMETKGASIDKVTVIEIPGAQNVEIGAERDPMDFWP